jgi:hypothetical protein
MADKEAKRMIKTHYGLRLGHQRSVSHRKGNGGLQSLPDGRLEQYPSDDQHEA